MQPFGSAPSPNIGLRQILEGSQTSTFSQLSRQAPGKWQQPHWLGNSGNPAEQTFRQALMTLTSKTDREKTCSVFAHRQQDRGQVWALFTALQNAGLLPRLEYCYTTIPGSPAPQRKQRGNELPRATSLDQAPAMPPSPRQAESWPSCLLKHMGKFCIPNSVMRVRLLPALHLSPWGGGETGGCEACAGKPNRNISESSC